MEKQSKLKVIDRSEIVMDDILFLGAGDQAQVDGSRAEPAHVGVAVEQIRRYLLIIRRSRRRHHIHRSLVEAVKCAVFDVVGKSARARKEHSRGCN